MKALERHATLTIVGAQLFGTSLWFSPNSAADDLMRAWLLGAAQFGQLTSAVQIGFIVGTLLLATTGLADRFAASRIFALSCVLGAGLNAAFALLARDLGQALVLRSLVGLCLAGIYPLGMKMIVAWSPGNAGSSLGLLVAMLTLGTALPQAVRAAGGGLSWQGVVLTSSALALVAAAAVFLLGDGDRRQAIARRPLQWGAALAVFRIPAFRASAIGYFGHMWELYAFWASVPFLVRGALATTTTPAPKSVALASFIVIAAGAIGCIGAGRLSRRIGSPWAAAIALGASGAICLLYPFIARLGMVPSLVALVAWGVFVIADSAQFSAISARTCPPDAIGSALAVQNSLGFAVTVVSITLVSATASRLGNAVSWILLPGPLVGLFFLRTLLRRDAISSGAART